MIALILLSFSDFCAIMVVPHSQGEPGADSAAAVDAVQATVDAVLAAATSGPHLVRGPHLAAVELAARKHRQQLAAGAGDSEASAMAIAEAVVAYFEVAATKVTEPLCLPCWLSKTSQRSDVP